MKFIDEIEIGGENLLIRLDLNVPISKEGKVADDSRITAALPTIKYALEQNAKIILCSHLGRPKGKPDAKFSLLPVGERLAELLGIEVIHTDDCIGMASLQVSRSIKPNQILLLENLRFHRGEKEGSPAFAEELKKYADIFISDGFGVLHRPHASVALLPRLARVSAAGFLVKKELEFLSKLLADPTSPYVVVLGGAKVSDKIKVISNLIERAEIILIGGGMAYTFLKSRGAKVGSSLVEEDKLEFAADIIKKCEGMNKKFYLPVDHVAADSIETASEPTVTESSDIPDGMMGLDIGPKTASLFKEIIKDAGTIFWNGPLGVFEEKRFSTGTLEIARAMAESDSLSVVGGGDSIAALNKANLSDKIDHISTGGGASLEFLEGRDLPGIVALEGAG